MKSTSVIFSWIAMLIPLLPLGVGLLRWKKLHQEQYRMLLLMGFVVLFGGLAEWTSYYWQTNLPLWHIFAPLELAFYAWIYAQVIRPKKPEIWIAVWLAFVAFALINALWIDGWANYPSTSLTVKSLLQNLLAIAYFAGLYRAMRVWKVEQEFGFWLSLGTLVLNFGGLLVSFFYQLILMEDDDYYASWAIMSTINMLSYLIFMVAMTCKNSTNAGDAAQF